MVSRAIITVFLSGMLAGIFVSGVQMLQVVPLILEAENLEINLQEQRNTPEDIGIFSERNLELNQSSKSKNLAEESNLKSDTSSLEKNHISDTWAPEEGFERIFYTFISNVLSGLAFSMILVAIFLLRGKTVNLTSGFLWGMAGFFVFSLAPSFGLPPELPGKTAAALEDRQFWWFFTVISSAAGIGLLTESKSTIAKIFALILFFLPHIIGPPKPYLFETKIPEELASKFVFASLLTSALFWAAVGILSGYLYKNWVQQFSTISDNN